MNLRLPPPLKGIKVVDLSTLLPGPWATQILTDLGASVVKIENPKGGDGIRHYPSSYLHSINRGKKSVALDLKSEDDRKTLVTTLLPRADVLVEGFRPGVLEKLLKRNMNEILVDFPSLIICRISGYGNISRPCFLCIIPSRSM